MCKCNSYIYNNTLLGIGLLHGASENSRFSNLWATPAISKVNDGPYLISEHQQWIGSSLFCNPVCIDLPLSGYLSPTSTDHYRYASAGNCLVN